VESGVFWQDEARAYLSADRVVVPVVASDVPLELIAATMPSRNRELFAVQCRVASSAVWDTLERGLPANRPIADISVAAQVEERLQTEQMLPATTAALSRILAEWVRD